MSKWRVGIYVRLSSDDKDKQESNSIVNQKNMIKYMNNAAKQIFGQYTENDSLLDIKNANITPGFVEINSCILQKTNFENKEIKYNNDTQEFCFNAILQNFNNENVLFLNDITEQKQIQAEINEEKEKNYKILMTILPQKFIHPYQKGDKNISISVEFASLCFIDIVGFSSWSSTSNAGNVVNTLNEIYSIFDKNLSNYPTLTKIKNIGDCYFYSGGILTDINQPEKITKETVDFGLDAIDGLSEFNSRTSNNFKIRIGLHVGGPIVAGIIGSNHPVFELIGKPINIAQQMQLAGEHNTIHITRSVYEIIYGASYNIKEKGEISIKNEKILSYTLTRKL